MPVSDTPIIVALDVPDLDRASALAAQLDPQLCRVKVGKELFTAHGPRAVEVMTERGFDVFLDLKFHDIPNTVAGACRAAANLGCWMINVHAGGGRRMLEAAADAVAASSQPPLLLAVTVLTSMDDDALRETGCPDPAAQQVVRLATLAQAAGCDGVVCSPLEIASIRAALDQRFVLVTPGVRPAGSATDDQSRVATPGAALRAGANYLVIGRPITQADAPGAALARIHAALDD